MSVNVGSFDRLFRIIVGLVLLAMTPLISGMMADMFGMSLGSPLGNIAWIGVVPLFTALVGWCPLYSIFGIKTCKTA